MNLKHSYCEYLLNHGYNEQFFMNFIDCNMYYRKGKCKVFVKQMSPGDAETYGFFYTYSPHWNFSTRPSKVLEFREASSELIKYFPMQNPYGDMFYNTYEEDDLDEEDFGGGDSEEDDW